MRINLGCGNQPLPDYINHDITKHRKEIDICFDLNSLDWKNRVWEAYGNEINYIRAYDVIEHLDDPLNFLNQCWDLLYAGDILELKACGWQNPNFFIDITHKKGFDIKSFDYVDPETELGKEYGYYTSKKWKIIEKTYDRHLNVIIKLKKI